MIDLYSDTHSLPTDAMWEAMRNVRLGDEQADEDPNVNALQDRVCELLGKPAALFLPSGTMCNLITVLVHCGKGERIFLDGSAHVRTSEAGGARRYAGVRELPLAGDRGAYTAEQLEAAIRARRRLTGRGGLVWVEQTSNRGGGPCGLWTRSGP